jgi:hypothetical protein
VPLELLVSVPGLAICDGQEYPRRGPTENDGRGRVLDRLVRRTRQRHDREVGALAGDERADLVVEPERTRAAEGAELQRLGGRQRVGPLLAGA